MKYALITGGGSGLGFELVREHVNVGYGVFALIRTPSDKLLKLAEEYPDRVEILPCDIGSTAAVESAMKQVREKTEVLDRIFNNAGIHRFEDWVTLDETELDFLPIMYNINAVGPLRILKAAMPLIKKGTVVIHISSEAASLKDQEAEIGYAYAMSKAGLNMGARIADNWMRPKGVRSVLIHPGRMRTGMQGPHSNIDPWETSEALMKTLEKLDSIPEYQMFMDYKGNPMSW